MFKKVFLLSLIMFNLSYLNAVRITNDSSETITIYMPNKENTELKHVMFPDFSFELAKDAFEAIIGRNKREVKYAGLTSSDNVIFRDAGDKVLILVIRNGELISRNFR